MSAPDSVFNILPRRSTSVDKSFRSVMNCIVYLEISSLQRIVQSVIMFIPVFN